MRGMWKGEGELQIQKTKGKIKKREVHVAPDVDGNDMFTGKKTYAFIRSKLVLRLNFYFFLYL